MTQHLQHLFTDQVAIFMAVSAAASATRCHDGLPWVESLLIDILEGRGEEGDLDILAHNAQFISGPTNTFCLHAPRCHGAPANALK